MAGEVNKFLLNAAYHCPYDSSERPCVCALDVDPKRRDKVELFLKNRDCTGCERKAQYYWRDCGDLEILSSYVEPKNKHTMDYTKRLLVLTRDAVLRINNGKFDVFHQLVVVVGGTGIYRTDNAAFLDVRPIFFDVKEPFTVYRSEVLGRACEKTVDYLARVLPHTGIEDGYYRTVYHIKSRMQALGGDVKCMYFENLFPNPRDKEQAQFTERYINFLNSERERILTNYEKRRNENQRRTQDRE